MERRAVDRPTADRKRLPFGGTHTGSRFNNRRIRRDAHPDDTLTRTVRDQPRLAQLWVIRATRTDTEATREERSFSPAGE